MPKNKVSDDQIGASLVLGIVVTFAVGCILSGLKLNDEISFGIGLLAGVGTTVGAVAYFSNR